MARLNIIKNSFNAGEISPYVLGRTDLEKYKNACESLVNWIPLVTGGIAKRPGTRYVVNAADQAGASRLVPFVYSPTQAFVLEFGNQTLRFYTNNGQVQSGGSPYQISTPYNTASDNLWDLKFAQQADVMYITHPNHPVYKLSRVSDTNWILAEPAFSCPPLHVYDQDISGGTITLTPAATSGSAVTFTASAPVFIAGDVGRQIVSGSGIASITALAGTTTTDPSTGATLYPQATCTILDDFASTAAIAAGSWLMRGAPQSYACYGSLDSSTPPNFYSTTKLGEGTTQNLYAFEKFPTNGGAPTYQDTFREADVGRYAFVGGAVGLITGLTSAREASVQLLSTITQTMANPVGNGNIIMTAASGGSWSLQDPAFNAANGYPTACCFFQDRLALAGTLGLPQNVWLSVTDDYENFAIGSLDDAAISFTINSGSLETIQAVEEFRGNLAVLTLRTEYMVGGGSVGLGGVASALTPSNVTAVRQSRYGAANIQPIVVDEDLIYVRRNQLSPASMSFSIQQSIFSSRNLALLNEIITKSGFKEMVYQQFPFYVVWFTTLDGNLVGLTYDSHQDVWAWARHFTGADAADQVVSVAAIPDPSVVLDQLWLCCKRTLNSVATYTIERMDPTLYVDCASQATFGPKVSQVGNLGYLAGRPVAANADGAVQAQATMTGAGTYNLEQGYTAANIQVGIPFTATCVTTRPDFNPTVQGILKRWNRVWARVYDTIGLLINGTRLAFRTPSDNLGQGVPELTGDVLADSNLDYDRDGRITVSHDQPLPATVLALFGTMSMGDA